MRLLIERLDEGGHVLGSHVIEHREARPFTIGPACDLDEPELDEPLRIVRGASGRTALHYHHHERELAFAEGVDFHAGSVRLRISLLAGDVGGLGLCPRCGGSLRESLGGGAYRTVARSIRSCPACGAQILQLAETAHAIGSFADTTSTDFFTVLTPRRCPECDGSLARSELRTARGRAEVERCLPCALLVLEAVDLELLAPRTSGPTPGSG